MSNTEVNKENSIVTYILQLDVKGENKAIKKFIKDDSAPYTYGCDEPKTMRFEWFLSKDETKVTLLEMFEDSDAAKLRVENLLASPLAEPFQNLFEPTSFTVLGSIKDDLREMLEGWGADFRDYAGGFYKPPTD